MKMTLQRLGKGLAILAAAVPLSAIAFPDKPPHGGALLGGWRCR
ncbi:MULTISPECIES: hypothetical protein [unclassified Cupriavidus]|nr:MULTISPECIES: hypothetical protein [unclassified Cupriavidus]